MYCIISTITDSKENADKILSNLIDLRYSPCIQVINHVESTYRWNDKIEKSIEYKIIIKSIDEYAKDIIDTIKLLHNYDIPEIVRHSISLDNADYEDWFLKNINKGE